MESWRACKNILVIRLDNMGDVVMNNAAFQELRNHFPTSRITLLTSSMAAPIVPYLGTVDETLVFDSPWMKIGESDQSASLQHLIADVKQRQFDACIIFNVYSQNIMPAAMLAYLADIPVRAGYSRENPYRLLTHWYPDPEPLSTIRHQIERDLQLLEVIGIRPQWNRLPRLRSASPASPLSFGPSPYTIVHLEVSEVKRQYPSTQARALIVELLDKGLTVLFTGQQHSPYLEDCISDLDSTRFVDLRGLTGIEQLLHLIEHAQGVICVNTGIMHVACAYQRPILALYANTNLQHTPWSTRRHLVTFEVPDNLSSKNQIITYAAQRYPCPEAPPSSASELVAIYRDLIS